MENFRIEGERFARMASVLGQNYMRRMVSEFGTVAVNFSKERFVKKDWFGQVHEKWTPRKRKARGSLLAKSGRLKRSIRKISAGQMYVMIGSDVPYASAHNQGEKGTKTVYVKAHQRKQTTHASTNLRTRKRSTKRVATGNMIQVESHTRKMRMNLPRRQFMGQSRALEIRLTLHLQKSIEKTLSKNL